ncbi:MAG: butyrate kinase [Bacteroidales bacterium]|nr:butyrate kinase [Bacteroidales bacterium]
MEKKYKILTINPGSTSTKIGVFENETKIFETTLRHSSNQLDQYSGIWDQYNFRKDKIIRMLEKNNYDLTTFHAVVGRGGLLKPIPNGTYSVDEEMIQDARIGIIGQHASNLGSVIAYSIAWEYNIPSYIVDPPSVDDFEDLARVAGNAALERTSLFHALNIFATARNFAKDTKTVFQDLNLIVAHLGGGISIAAIQKGKAINSNNGLQEGPFSPERSGSLPPLALLDMAFSGKYTHAEMKKMIVGKGGLVSYFGTNKAHEVENMIHAGSKKHKRIFEAMAYQIAEAIGARATNLKGKVDAIILTGGIAHSKMLTCWINDRVKHIAKVHIYPGELELEALAAGALRALRGEESVKRYNVKIPKVGIYYWDNIEAYVAAINHIEDLFREKNFVFRKEHSNLEIIYGNCKENEDRAKIMAERLVDNNVDIIFAIGSPSSTRAAQYLKDSGIPLIYTGIYNESVLGLNFETDNSEFFATTYSIKIKEQFEKTILKIDPKIKKIGVTYHIGELQSNIEHDEIREFCLQKGIECVSFDIQSRDDFTEAANYFENENVKWVYLGSDTIIATSTGKQLEPITSKFATVCALQDTVTHGGLIAYNISWKIICRTAAEFAVKVLNGIEINKAIVTPNDRRITINKETCELFKHLKITEKIENAKII